MTAALGCWVVAMAAALWASRRLARALVAVTAAVFAWEALSRGVVWTDGLSLAALVLTPMLLSTQQERDRQAVALARQRREAALSGLSQRSQAVLAMGTTTRALEQRITALTRLYQVTKATSGALHPEALVVAFMEAALPLLGIERMRLLDAEGTSPRAFRAVREGGQVTLHTGVLEPEEQALRQQATAEAARPVPVQGVLGDVAVVAMALRRQKQVVGVLVAEALSPHAAETFAVVADQLALQYVRVYLYQRVEALAVTDALTGVWVRRHFVERALDELARAGRQRLAGTLLMVDLDRFKEKNDTYGHLVGDVVLRDVAQLMRRHLRDIDLMARFGGEEFVILLPEADVSQALPIAQRLRQLIEVHPIRAYDELLAQTVSIGLAAYPAQGTTLEQLMERADQALYAAKHDGRNRVVTWAAAMDRQ